MSRTEKSRRPWIEETFFKRECVSFIPSTRDLHRCVPVCNVCQNLIRCCCGRLIGEHFWPDSCHPLSMFPRPGQETEDSWSLDLHTRASPTDAYGTVDFQDSAARVCRAKYVRVAVDSKAEAVLQLMIREWQMERPKLLITVQGGSENLTLPPKVKQAFSKGLVTAALSTGAWILTDGVNTGISRLVGEAVKTFGSHNLRKRNTVGVTPWGMIDNNADLIGRDVFRPYQPLGNPLLKRACLNSFHSHFLLVDDGTMGKHGCQQSFRRRVEKHIHQLRIHPRLNQRVPVVCVVVEGGPATVSTVLDYVSSEPPVPVFVFEGSGKAADLLAFIHKHTATERQLDGDLLEDFLVKIANAFEVERTEALGLYALLLKCMDHRQSITTFDSESEDQQSADSAILTSILKGTKASPAEQLSMALAWDRADVAMEHILVYGQHWQRGSLEQAMLDALVMDRVGFVKLLIDNGMTMSTFLTVERLEELYNTPRGPTDSFLHYLVEDVKQSSLPRGYHLTLIDMGLVIEYLIGGAYRSTYTRKTFRAAYNHLHVHKRKRIVPSNPTRTPQRPHFFRTAQPYRRKDRDASPGDHKAVAAIPASDVTLLVHFNFNDLFVWAVLQRRQQMALFLWQLGEEALARATVACKLYRSMASEARQSSTDDNMAELLQTYSLEFGQLAVDMLDCAFRQSEQMAMKLLTSEMEAWSHFTCLQMAVSSGLRPFVSHSCTQTLLTDLWTGSLNMRKNSFLKIILSLLLPPAILLLEFKSQAEMCHVPQSQEALLFGRDSGKAVTTDKEEDKDAENGVLSSETCLGLLSSFTRHCSSWIRRFYGCYTAPVVKFWFHTMSYLAFLMFFSYTVLVKMEDRPSIPEWLVIAYILSTAVEKTREVLMSEPRKLSQKLKIWFSEYWNVSDFIAILLFLVGLTLRWHSGSYRLAGRLSYCLDIIFWFVRVLDLLAVNQHAGPYLTMITKMTSNMFFIVAMMAIVLLTFGVSRKAILSPDEEPSWSLARDVVFQPYWMIFGEVYAGEIDVCAKDQPCPPGAFLTPFLQAVYLFFQYIIMVNILIAFFNNVYFDMASTSNQLWKYNRYRYITTYQERPWLPPPFILLSHMALGVSALYRRLCGGTEHEGRCSGLKLYLCQEDRKRLHEFEENCVHVHFHERKESLLSSQNTRMKATAERVEEMSSVVGEVSERVHVIQDSLSVLDGQLGQLQDLSVLAVDTLTLLSASDSLHKKDTRMARCQPVPHSWTPPLRAGGGGDVISVRRMQAKTCNSVPPSLLRGCTLTVGRLAPAEGQVGVRRSKDRSPGKAEKATVEVSPSTAELMQGGHRFVPHGSFLPLHGAGVIDSCLWDRTPYKSQARVREPERPHHRPRTCDPSFSPSQEPTSMEEEVKEQPGEEDQQKSDEEEVRSEDGDGSQPSNGDLSPASSAVLLSDPCDISEGFLNPAFYLGHSQPRSRHLPPSQWAKIRRTSRWASMSIERPFGHCRSLSSSVENITFAGSPISPLRGSFPFLSGPISCDSERGEEEDTSLRCSTSQERTNPSDVGQLLGNTARGPNKKSVKIQEDRSPSTMNVSELHRRRSRNLTRRCWSASTSLSQLNVEPMEFLQKQVIFHPEMWSPSQTLWNSLARSGSRRSSLQSGIAPEAKSSLFHSTEDLYPHYSAMERNNLMRLAHTIPFTPLPFLGGEEVSVYSLEESGSASCPSPSTTSSSWSSQGLSAMLQPLYSEEGSLDGGLCLGRRVLCTWAERDVLRPGLVYVVKAFRPEVVRTWQRLFHGRAALQLCLREIQQQRAAQKMMEVFNQIRPEGMSHSPRFVDVSLLLWHSNGQWLTIERYMPGNFRKYNNNTGEEIAPCCSLEETLLAFSHWTYEYSCRELLVLDIQGVGEKLTDPSVIKAEDQSSCSSISGEMQFGPDNLGNAAISSFLLKHKCNSSCHKLGLSDFRKGLGQVGEQP